MFYREIVFKADLFLRLLDGIVHWTILLLRNLQSLGNESEHLAPPALEFFGDVSVLLLSLRTFLSAYCSVWPGAVSCASE